MAPARNKHASKTPTNQLRIIGGQWRGRKLNFPSIDGLRPTPDRVRETLFNWLAPVIPGSRCLDLFAGSGALGLEALSRGATHSDLIDSASEVVNQLRENLRLLNANNGQTCGQVWAANANDWLQQFNPQQHPAYDVIFLDPPFHQGQLEPCIKAIQHQQLLADQSWVYLEMAIDEPLPVIPDHWHLHREKNAGQVCYRLFAIKNR